MGRIEIQSNNIPYFVDQQWIAGKLKALRTMRLQPEGPPDAADRGLAQSGLSRQHAAGPMGSSLRSLFQREAHEPFDLFVADLARRSRTRFISESGNALGNETVAPEADSETGRVQLRSYRCITRSAGTCQNNPGAERRRSGTARLPRNTLQLNPLHRVHD